MATARKLWAGLRRWFNGEDVDPKRRSLVAGGRQLWVAMVGIPVLGGSIIGIIGDAAGWW
jgi:hypothetical protein